MLMPFFNFSSVERRGIIALCGILLLAIAVVGLFLSSKKKDGNAPESMVGRRSKGQITYAYPKRSVETFTFDPNLADSTELLRLGLAPYMVRGIYKYRSMGGVYNEPSDFKRVPGLTNEMWERLSPYIRIDRRFQRVEPEPYVHQSHTVVENASLPSLQTRRDTVRYTQKLREGEMVELNGSDTTAFKKIPGIGSYYARKIMSYRRDLGGFVSLSQVHEIDGVPASIEQYLTLGDVEIKKININKATKAELCRHPYIGSFRAQSIWDHRHNHGTLKDIEDLRKLMYFSEEDIQRLAPYLDFK